MKFLIYSKIVLAIISLVLSTGLKSENRAGLKNQRSAVEFFNSILLQQNTTDNNSSAGNDTVPSDPVEPYMSDWLMISSELFNNPLIFFYKTYNNKIMCINNFDLFHIYPKQKN